MSKPNNQCSVCKEIFVVDSLARICEMKHQGVVFVHPEYKLVYKDLPKSIEMLYNVPAPIIREDLYGEIQKIQVQSN